MKNEETITELVDVIIDALSDEAPQRYDISKDQPWNTSWVHFYWGYAGLASEYTTGIEYGNSDEFQEQLVSLIRKVFTPTNLQLVRDAKLTEFGMHIGPYLPSGGSINDELGIDVIDEMKDREGIE